MSLKFAVLPNYGIPFAGILPCGGKLVNQQALGRVIRSDKDYGIRVLLDARYNKNSSRSVFKEFHKDEQREFREYYTQYLKDTVIKDFKLFRK